MYKFIDVTEIPEGALLPSEALKINGEYIENLIPGYRTLTVEGREALSPEVATYKTGIRDGSLMSGKRYPARTIRVTYRLLCGSNEDFRTAFNKLGGILDVKDAELIFDDEPDKYFIGTPSRIGEVTPGRNSVKGEFDILCLDPFKYSVMEYVAASDPGGSNVFIDYGGTYKSFPKLVAEFYKESEASEDGETAQELTGDGECGFVAFFNEREKIIQLGDPEERDGDSDGYPASQTQFQSNFNSSKAWGTVAKADWAVNNGVLASSRVAQIGAPGISAASYTGGTAIKKFTNKILTITSAYERPHVVYDVYATVTNRRATACDVTVTVKTRLKEVGNYFGRGYELLAEVTIGNKYRILSLKNKDEYWKNITYHSREFYFANVPIASGNTNLPEVTLTVTRPDELGWTGVLNKTKCNNLIIPAYVAPTPETYYLTAASSGDHSKDYTWHGPTITQNIREGRNPVHFNLSFFAKICAETSGQKGKFECHVVSGGKILAGIECYKRREGTIAKVRFYVNGDFMQEIEVDISKTGEIFTENSAVTITKIGSRVEFALGKKILKIYTDSSIAETAAESVTFGFLNYAAADPLAYNGVSFVRFVKDNCETWKDIPNKFKTNDVVEADCSTGAITLNGVAAHSLGALGNDWEGFYLMPGLNQIGTAHSDWVSEGYEPTFKVKYREVFL